MLNTALKIHAHLIDPESKTVRTILLTQTHFLKDAYNLIGCSLIQQVWRFGETDILYADEEALLNKKALGWFAMPKYFSQPIKGRAIVVGVGPEGETISATRAREFYQRYVSWLDKAQLANQWAINAAEWAEARARATT